MAPFKHFLHLLLFPGTKKYKIKESPLVPKLYKKVLFTCLLWNNISSFLFDFLLALYNGYKLCFSEETLFLKLKLFCKSDLLIKVGWVTLPSEHITIYICGFAIFLAYGVRKFDKLLSCTMGRLLLCSMVIVESSSHLYSGRNCRVVIWKWRRVIIYMLYWILKDFLWVGYFLALL